MLHLLLLSAAQNLARKRFMLAKAGWYVVLKASRRNLGKLRRVCVHVDAAIASNHHSCMMVSPGAPSITAGPTVQWFFCHSVWFTAATEIPASHQPIST